MHFIYKFLGEGRIDVMQIFKCIFNTEGFWGTTIIHPWPPYASMNMIQYFPIIFFPDFDIKVL